MKLEEKVVVYLANGLSFFLVFVVFFLYEKLFPDFFSYMADWEGFTFLSWSIKIVVFASFFIILRAIMLILAKKHRLFYPD